MKTLLNSQLLSTICLLLLAAKMLHAEETTIANAERILECVRKHDFNPIRDGFTFDRKLNKHGVADLNDTDWQIRTLAVRDLVSLGADAIPHLLTGLLKMQVRNGKPLYLWDVTPKRLEGWKAGRFKSAFTAWLAQPTAAAVAAARSVANLPPHPE